MTTICLAFVVLFAMKICYIKVNMKTVSEELHVRRARITIFAGHYGSGKTTLALSYALALRKENLRATLCDLDIVNPYFRTADARGLLAERGVSLIASPFAGTNVDAPALPADTRRIFDDPDGFAAIDLGGDERGALALGRYASLVRESDFEMLLIVNPYRPLTRTARDISAARKEIETAARVPFTGLINNANLGGETTVGEILASIPPAKDTARALGLPMCGTAVWDALLTRETAAAFAGETIFPIRRFTAEKWQL